MKDICKRLSEVITASNLSYAELEKRTNIAKSSIQRYATGKTKKIPIEAIKLIAKATNSSAAYLMGWESQNKEEAMKEDAVADIFLRLRQDSTFYDAVQKLYNLNDAQLTAIITMLSSFEKN